MAEAMNDVTQILSRIESGDPSAADQLLPLVYDELRTLARAKLMREGPGQTLQPTALVHEAYLRLAGSVDEATWENLHDGGALNLTGGTLDAQSVTIPTPFGGDFNWTSSTLHVANFNGNLLNHSARRS
jgi:ECF sigma factor